MNNKHNMSSKPSLSPRRHPLFTPIQECERELENDDEVVPSHPPTHLHPPKQNPEIVSYNKCGPCTSRDKNIIVPLDNTKNTIKSLITSLKTKKSPAVSRAMVAQSPDQWRGELSSKLRDVTKKRDEAVLEASRMKNMIAELEKQVERLESNNSRIKNPDHENHDKVIDYFLVSVSEARTSIRILSRALTLQLSQVGSKVHDRISLLLDQYDAKISISKNPRAVVFYLEAFLNRIFFENFESVGFSRSAPSMILNPMDRCEKNFQMFENLKGLSWEEVLSKGTKHFSEDFSKFCDRKMSEVAAMFGWNRAWPEPLLKVFFNGSKSVWLVHLLANSVHPGLPVFRVDKGVKFDPVYMEDTSEAKARKLVPSQVRIMIAPGFYVGNNVVKCKVLCRYHSGFGDKGLTPSPV